MFFTGIFSGVLPYFVLAIVWVSYMIGGLRTAEATVSEAGIPEITEVKLLSSTTVVQTKTTIVYAFEKNTTPCQTLVEPTLCELQQPFGTLSFKVPAGQYPADGLRAPPVMAP